MSDSTGRYRPTFAGRLFIATCGTLLLALTAWLYWPGISGPDMLDDRTSLAVLDELNERPELALDFIYGDRSGPLGRTVSLTTFVAEKLYFDDGFAGYKRVNILLHLFNGTLVIWLFSLLLKHARVPGHRELALALGAIWLLHPLFVSTVLYAVQRMAMLSTTFMLLTAISYLKWRQGVLVGQVRWLPFLPVPVFFSLGMLSKENTAVILPILLLLEVLWLECRDARGVAMPWLRRCSLGLIAVGGAFAMVLLLLSLDSLEARHAWRPFTLEERVLTQTRLLWDYVGQWFLPDISRMGIYHDDLPWSRSLTQPITTFYSIVAWSIVAVGWVLALRWRWGRYAAFAVAWYLVGHSIESTVWPLELAFEHRNYFPAIGLVLLVGVIIGAVVSAWRETRLPLLAWLSCGALALTFFTSPLVQVWSARPLLILHHLNGHPDSSRANTDMAVQVAHLGSVERALYYSRRAYDSSFVEREGDWAVRDIALLCIAGAPVSSDSISRVGAADIRRPLGSVSTLLTLVRMLQDNQCPGIDRQAFADHLASIYLRKDNPASASTNMYANMAVLENALERWDLAFQYTQKLLAQDRRHTKGLLMHLHFATALEDEEARDEVLNTLQGLDRRGKLSLGEQQTLQLYLEN